MWQSSLACFNFVKLSQTDQLFIHYQNIWIMTQSDVQTKLHLHVLSLGTTQELPIQFTKTVIMTQ